MGLKGSGPRSDEEDDDWKMALRVPPPPMPAKRPARSPEVRTSKEAAAGAAKGGKKGSEWWDSKDEKG